MKFYGSIAAGSARFGYVLSRIRIKVQILDPDMYSKLEVMEVKVMDGFQWNFMNERLCLISGAIRDAVSVSGFYPDYWLRWILTKFGAEMAPTTWKSWVSCRSSRSKVKVKHNKNTTGSPIAYALHRANKKHDALQQWKCGINALACYKQKCKLTPFNFIWPTLQNYAKNSLALFFLWTQCIIFVGCFSWALLPEALPYRIQGEAK